MSATDWDDLSPSLCRYWWRDKKYGIGYDAEVNDFTPTMIDSDDVQRFPRNSNTRHFIQCLISDEEDWLIFLLMVDFHNRCPMKRFWSSMVLVLTRVLTITNTVSGTRIRLACRVYEFCTKSSKFYFLLFQIIFFTYISWWIWTQYENLGSLQYIRYIPVCYTGTCIWNLGMSVQNWCQ